METDRGTIRKLKEIGMSDEILALYQSCCDNRDESGRERLLRRFFRIKKDLLAEERRKLSCLDYMMARIEHM